MSSVQGFQPQEISTHSGENFKNLYHSSPNCHETMDAETNGWKFVEDQDIYIVLEDLSQIIY